MPCPRPPRAALAVTSTLLLAACHLSYEVTMTPSGDTLQRDVSVSSDIAPEELEALRHSMGAHHDAGSEGPDPRLLFSGDVSGPGWPDGFGGRGNWTIHESPLGTATCFLECLGGDVRAVDDILALQKGIDAVIKRLRRELRTALSGDPMLPRMLRLLDNRIHPDAADAALLGWALLFSSHMLPDTATTGDGPGRQRMQRHIERRMSSAAVAFLWQRHWLTADEAIIAMADPDQLDDLFPRIAARALDLDLSGDYEAHLKAIGERFTEAFPEDFDDELASAFTSAVGNRTRLAVAWAATSSILTNREVTVRMHSPEEPAMTNGTWSADTNSVQWTLDTAPIAVGLTAPPLCWSASWAHPNQARQLQLLGHVGIDGTDLVDFAVRWSAATADQQESVRHILESFETARSGTDIKVQTTDIMAECRRVFDP